MPADGSSFSRISIAFEKLSSAHEYDDESYLEKIVADIGKVPTYEIQGEPTTTIIAGNIYTKVVVCEFDTIKNMYFRILDDYAVFISLTGDSDAVNDAVVNMFTPVG